MKRREFMTASAATLCLPWLPQAAGAADTRLHEMFQELGWFRTRPDFIGFSSFETQDAIGFEALLDNSDEPSGLEQRLVQVPRDIAKPQWLPQGVWQHFSTHRGRAVLARLFAEGLNPEDMSLPYMAFDFVSSEVKADRLLVSDPEHVAEYFDDLPRLVQRMRELQAQGFGVENLVYPYSKATAAWHGYRCSRKSPDLNTRWQVMLNARVPYWEDWYDPSGLPGFEAVVQDGFPTV